VGLYHFWMPWLTPRPWNIGLSLGNPDDPMIADLAVAAHQILGDELDALLLGNVSTPSHNSPTRLLT